MNLLNLCRTEAWIIHKKQINLFCSPLTLHYLCGQKSQNDMPKDKIENPTKNLTVKEWNSEDQPREKLMLHGAQSLSNSELLAILLRTGLKGENVLALSQRILSSVNNDLARLGSLNVEQILRDFKGIGPAKALTIAAAMELASRRRKEVDVYRKVKSSTDLYEAFAPGLQDCLSEEVHIAFIDGAGQIRKIECISKGSFDCSLLDVRIIVTKTLLGGYTTIALAHNHPSGYASPSTADIQSTREILRGCQMMRIRLIDHIIIANNEYYSFSDKEQLEEI